MQPVKPTVEETPVYPDELMRLLRVTRTFSVNRMIKAGRVPAPDVQISQRVRYWHRSTIRELGLLPKQGSAA
jgi:hypothetical protein